LAKSGDEEGSSSTGSIFMVQEPEQLKSIVASADGSVRVFLGHAGWKSGQLEEELAAGVWHLLTIQPDLFFSDGPQMWIEAIREVGCQFYRDVLKVPGFPADATMN
jgi:putative transcriptional regulator